MNGHPGYVDTAELVAFVNARGGLTAVGAGRHGDKRLKQAYYRGVRRGRLSVLVADELAVSLLGCHPAEVWGPEWIGALEGACAPGADRHSRTMQGHHE